MDPNKEAETIVPEFKKTLQAPTSEDLRKVAQEIWDAQNGDWTLDV